jgi:hypothetical protein
MNLHPTCMLLMRWCSWQHFRHKKTVTAPIDQDSRRDSSGEDGHVDSKEGWSLIIMMGRGSHGALSDVSAVHFVVLAAEVAHMFTAPPLVAAVQSSGQLGGGSGAALVFGPPVVLPVFCPQSLCKYGGSTAADDFTAFPPPHNNVIIGSVNRSVTYSTDNGATFQMMDSASAKITEAKSVIGPGVLFPCGSNSSSLCSLGGTTLDGIDPSVVNASIVSRWTLPSGLKSQDPPRRDVNTTADVVWDLPDGSHACQFVGYAGKVRVWPHLGIRHWDPPLPTKTPTIPYPFSDAVLS